MAKEEALEALRLGMSTEIWGQRFYEEAAARTEAEDGKRVFQSLAVEERQHLDILRGQYAALTAARDWVSVKDARAMAASVDPTDIFPQGPVAGQLIPEDATDEQALEMAKDFERRGYALYEQAARKAISPEAKAMWEYLASAEDQHYAFLDRAQEYLATKGAWYFDDQELPSFEG